VSLPFSDYCEPISSDEAEFTEVFESLVKFGRQSGWRYVEIRGSNSSISRLPHFAYHYGHVVDLAKGVDGIYAGLRDSNRRNISKAQREGVKVSIDRSAESLQEYYRLHCITRRKHGLPPQPERFFGNIHAYVLEQGLGVVALARFGGRTVAGAVYVRLGKRALYKYGASDGAYHYLRANNMVMWEAIKWFAGRGFESLCLGRTEPGNRGLMQYKSGWGARKRIIKYYRYDTSRNVFLSDSSNPAYGVHNAVLTRMPVAVLRPLGKLLYKHVG
jgi:lipid II:glycine glycyltransferase (peptidoglycan interpeptide bridge formation enzyme)